MKTRVLTGALILAVILPILFFSEYIIYPIALGLFCAAALFEVFEVIGVKKQLAIVIPSYVLALCLPFFVYFAPELDRVAYLYFLFGALLIFMMYLFCVMVLKKGELSYSKIAEVFMLVAYVTTSFTALSLIRYLDNGKYILFLVFIASWVTDTFAYLTGTLIGKHKLIPEVSPKKTVEGAIGGTLSAVVFFPLLGFIVGAVSAGEVKANYLVLVIYAVILAVVAQIGDLLASLIKREHGIKDYGNIFPGHGGVMDRFDSILAISTILMAICILFPLFA